MSRRRTGLPLDRLEFVAIDIETTGLDPRRDEIVALAAVPFAGGRPSLERAWTSLVNPGRPIPPEARAIHGISDDAVRDAPRIDVALREFLAVCRGRPIVAHTAGFDLTVINRAARTAGLAQLDSDVLDIGVIAHGLYPSWWDLTLEGLARLLEVEPLDRHTALGDAITAGLLFVRMMAPLQRRGISTLAGLLKLERGMAMLPEGPIAGGGLAGP